MTKWRYHSLLVRDLSVCDSKLNAEGDKGWELVAVLPVDANTARAFFKMPITEEQAVAAALGGGGGASIAEDNPFSRF